MKSINKRRLMTAFFGEKMKNKNIETAEKIAAKIKINGGTAYYVGGFVRDRLRKVPCSDIDIEVHGIEIKKLKEILPEFGEVVSYGESFGIFALKGRNIDIAVPRKERATGRGHRDFEIFADPYIGTYKAALRRDFTVNAMMEDVLTGEITDHFGGENDIKNEVLRHVNDKSFCEDPLRVLRLAQFASRFGYSVAPETMELCRKIDLSSLSRERVFDEMKKALMKSDRPSVFFEVLREARAMDYWFPEVKALSGVKQNPTFHPEGDVWTHTMMVLDTAVKFRNKVNNPMGFMLGALCHDFGKVICTRIKEGRIISYNHEIEGLPLVKNFISRLTDEKKLTEYVLNLVKLHMRPNSLVAQGAGIKASNRLFDESLFPEDLIYFSECDSLGKSACNESELMDRLEIYRRTMSRPYVKGHDLINAGLVPDENFSDILNFAHKLRVAGLNKNAALKQTLTYAEKLKK